MNQQTIDRIRRSSVLLPPPGGEVVRQLLDEIQHLQECDNEPYDCERSGDESSR